MKPRLLPLSLALATAAWCTLGFALDLPEAFEKALQQDASLRASRAALASAMERVPQARAQLLPSIQASFTRNHNDLDSTTTNFLGRSTTTTSKYYSHAKSITVRQALYNPLRSRNLEQAKHLQEEAIATHQRNEQDLLVRVVSAYAEVLMAQHQLVLFQSLTEQEQTQLLAARKNFASGAGTRTDIDEAQARLDLSAAKELEAKQNLDYSQHQLSSMVGEPVLSLAALNPHAAHQTLASLEPLDKWVEVAKQHSAELRILQARVNAATLEVSKAQAGHSPTLDAVLQRTDNGNDNESRLNSRYENTIVGLQLLIPIYQGGTVSSQVRQALAEQTRMQEMLEANLRDLTLRLHKEHRGVTEGLVKAQALLQAEHSALQSLTSTKRSREAGLRTILDVLNAEQQLAMVRRDLQQTRFQALLSYLRLSALAGKETQEVMQAISVAFSADPGQSRHAN